MATTTTTLPRIPSRTADALTRNGWQCGNRTADRSFGNGVRAAIRTDGTFYVTVRDVMRFEGREPQHETLEWTICCTAMEANEVAWSQPEYKTQFAREG